MADEVVIKTETSFDNKEIHYTVEKNGSILWSRIVEFGYDLQHRAGGLAFREAAKAQETFARRYQDEHRADASGVA